MNAKSLMVVGVVCLVGLSGQAAAALSKAEAVTLCKQEIRQQFGEPSKTRLKRIRSGGKRVQMRVTTETGSTTVTCEFDKEKLVSLSPPAPSSSVAQQSRKSS